ncbi:MAG: hypothetical protein Q8Q51_09270 [Lutibacter sp.]|jgi:hypothetical protein|nr:hypothetical protein [Lutibacter sp.]
MKTIIKTVLFLLIVTSFGCEKDNETITINESDKLIGHWINSVSNDAELKLTRANSLKNDAYGISFLTKSQCIERSSGWCGTPPLTFFDYQGTWTRNDAILIITIASGINGLEAIQWEIKTLNDKYLIIERIRET